VLSPGGSSSPIGTANFWAANVGTETGRSSAGWRGVLVGIKPTMGGSPLRRHSDYGDQDTLVRVAGSVTDAAVMLGALEARRRTNDPRLVRARRRQDATIRSS
jgi:Asp-tRNA(Asn)/Glu-tRNA(Gln) amidotransferase A subunit family amidase